MKKDSESVVLTAVAIFAVIGIAIAGLMTVVSYKWNDSAAFGQYVVEKGPWGTEGFWVSDNADSYLVCCKESPESPYSYVIAYYNTPAGWIRFNAGCNERTIYMDSMFSGDSCYQGRMEFDGEVFSVLDISARNDGVDPPVRNYHYTMTDDPAVYFYNGQAYSADSLSDDTKEWMVRFGMLMDYQQAAITYRPPELRTPPRNPSEKNYERIR